MTPATTLTTLPNGLRVVLHPMPATYSASIVVVIGAGSRYEDDAEAGISHVLEHMLFKGTARRPSAQLIADTVERLGGRLNAATSREMTSYYTKVPFHHVEVGLDLLADMLRGSLLDEAEIEREKGVIIEEIAQGEDAPTVVGAHLLQRIMWGPHPLGRPVIGTRQSVQAVTREALCSYLATHYIPDRIVLSVAGNIDPEAVASRVEELLGDWSGGSPRTPLPAVYPADGEPAGLAPHDGQAHLFMAAPGVPLDHPDHMVLALLAELLGGGMGSRLFLEVRERRGLAYSVGAAAGTLSDHGTLSVHAGVAPARASGALDVIVRELRRLVEEQAGVDELERLRGRYEGALLLALEDSYSVALRNARSVLQRGYARTPEETLAFVEAVTARDVQRLAAELLSPSALRLAVVGPFDDIAPFAAAMTEQG